MKLAHLTVLFVITTAATACTHERALAPQPVTSSIAPSVAPELTQVPLLFVVDGVRLQRDQVPSLSGDQIASVQVIKGRSALSQYGPDASYGVVVIKTKTAATPRS
jgi:TonB-dependent SusC/RagA subfamily outer membrane receptor